MTNINAPANATRMDCRLMPDSGSPIMEEIGGDPAAQQSANHTHDNTTNPPITFPFTISPANRPAINPTTIQVILAERPSDRMFRGYFVHGYSSV